MKLHVIFIGTKFVHNKILQEYVMRKVDEKVNFVDSITYVKESDNRLFLYLEEQLNRKDKTIIITTKQIFSTVGKLLCTATEDNQVLKNGMLIPQKATLFQEKTYLLEYENSIVNVLQMDEGEEMPEVLMYDEEVSETCHLFNEDKETSMAILNPIAQSFEVNINIVKEVHGWLRVDVSSNKYGNISKFTDSAKQLLPRSLIVSSNIMGYIIERLEAAGKKLSFAESCTGGLLSYYLTRNNGASNVFNGSLITYSNSLKENWLAVPANTLELNGAVSSEVVAEMSDGALNVSEADYALSVSGIAGDGGGTEDKPVGTVYIGVRSKEHHKEEHLHFKGDRNYVQHQSALYALKMLLLVDKELFF